eukprot:CAMPEP_0177656932 /NCGR_PEP_ID=MMETSP0447-20121125/15877_1 /TAXON_ID=0 /ORGANISM="Stygamoeba regulata, Strain BSH-02190019" /LENGTH=391 /DNA_ID=CAMNT_0019161177 /DNA_START=192 /DNA_END=1364 /DNA_ORIENTATION=-
MAPLPPPSSPSCALCSVRWIHVRAPPHGQHDRAHWEAPLAAALDHARTLQSAFRKLTELRRRELCYSLYPYLWDVKEEAELFELFLMQHFPLHYTLSSPADASDSAVSAASSAVALGGSGSSPLSAPCSCPSADWNAASRVRAAEASATLRAQYVPGTYRGGFLAELQQLLDQRPLSGRLEPSRRLLEEQAQTRLRIVPYHPRYREGAYRVCLETGDEGADGTHLYPNDPLVLGHRYAGPYMEFEPQHCWMLVDQHDQVLGYTMGVLDTEAFYARYRAEWLPRMLALYPEAPAELESDPTKWSNAQQVIHLFHSACDLDLDEQLRTVYPSHLHIDIVARAQGQGWGTKLLSRLIQQLREEGSPGAHLGMAPSNLPALHFYQDRFGFEVYKH